MAVEEHKKGSKIREIWRYSAAKFQFERQTADSLLSKGFNILKNEPRHVQFQFQGGVLEHAIVIEQVYFVFFVWKGYRIIRLKIFCGAKTLGWILVNLESWILGLCPEKENQIFCIGGW